MQNDCRDIPVPEKHVYRPFGVLCPKISNSPESSISWCITELRTTANYKTNRPIQQAIQKLKSDDQAEIADKLGTRLFEAFKQTGWPITLIVAVSLAPARLRERGHNQAALLAESLARQTGLPFYGETLRCVRDTRSQVGLKADLRQANVERAFAAERDLAKGQTILLVDDFYASGATLNACASALLALVVAYPQG